MFVQTNTPVLGRGLAIKNINMSEFVPASWRKIFSRSFGLELAKFSAPISRSKSASFLFARFEILARTFPKRGEKLDVPIIIAFKLYDVLLVKSTSLKF